jgi:hypothetical protein
MGILVHETSVGIGSGWSSNGDLVPSTIAVQFPIEVVLVGRSRALPFVRRTKFYEQKKEKVVKINQI